MWKPSIACAVALGIFLVVAVDCENRGLKNTSNRKVSTARNLSKDRIEVVHEDEGVNEDENIEKRDDESESVLVGDRSLANESPRIIKEEPFEDESEGEDTENQEFPEESDGNHSVVIEPRRRPKTIEPAYSEDDEEVDSEQQRNTTCGPPPEIEGAIVPVLEGFEHAAGTTVMYQCNFGYVSRSSVGYMSVCELDEWTGNAEWTAPDISCIARSCGDPGYVINGRRIGNLFTFPNKVEFECDEGYKLRGFRARFCQAGGDWSGRLPTCELIYCSAPSDPANGRVRYSSLDYGTELRYECDRGYMLKNHSPRFCTSDGTWSNNEPECIEASCQKPDSPAHGSVQLFGEPKVGSVAIYSCDEGTTMIGTTTSKCLKSGIWTFDPPKCLRSCQINYVNNGEAGWYKTVRRNRRDYQQYVKFQVGETVKHNETVILRCRQGFVPSNRSKVSKDGSDEVPCSDGTWSKPLQCQESTCEDDPPPLTNGAPKQFNRQHGSEVLYQCNEHFEMTGRSTVRCEGNKWTGDPPTCNNLLCNEEPPAIENGTAMIESRDHGSIIWYRCRRGTEKLKMGRVICEYGKWNGNPPVCGDSRCYTTHLNYPGLRKPKGTYFRNNTRFVITCEQGYQKTFWKDAINCLNGEWDTDIKENPCSAGSCENDPPTLTNGEPKQFTRDHGSEVLYQCNEHFEMTGRSTVRCEGGKWTGEPPTCNELKNEGLEESSVTKPSIRREHHVTSEPWNPSSPSGHVGECFCTYDYPTGFIIATVENRRLEPESRVEQGEKVSFSCLYNMRLQWPNGLRFSGAVELTCNACEKWTQIQLPVCSAQESGESLLVYNNDMKILPGGTIEILQGKRMEFQCVNQWLQPAWNIGDRTGIFLTRDSLVTTTQTGLYSAYMLITGAIDLHSGTYECLSTDHSRNLKPTMLDLRIVEAEIQCPELRKNTDRGTFTITYENDRKVNTVAYYACQDRNKILYGSASRICTENGKWSGTYPSCEDVTCEEFKTYNGLIVSFSNRNKVNSIARFRCNGNAKLIGSSSSKCESNGAWSNPKPSCELVDIRCPFIDEKGIFSIRYVGDRRINTTAQFYCVADHQKVEGCNFVTCQPNAEWSGGYPACIDYDACNRFEDSEGLTVDYSHAALKEGSTASFSCLHPYTLNGMSSATCQRDGTWSDPSPTCDAPRCSVDVLDLPEAVVSDQRDVPMDGFVPQGFELPLLCEDGFVLTGNTKATCGLRGRWEYGTVICTQACSLNKDNLQGLIIEPKTQEHFFFGDYADFSCPPGKIPSSEDVRIMCLGHSWSHPIPSCVDIKQKSPQGVRQTTKSA